MPTPDPTDSLAMETALVEVRRRGRRRLLRRRSLAGVATVALAAVIVPVSLITGGSPGVRVKVGTTGSNQPPARPGSGLVVPDTYPGTTRPVPAELKRPLHLPVLRAGQSCPTSTGERFDNPGFGGTALGRGPVRVIIGNEGDLAHGQADLGVSAAAGWLAIQTIWFADPAYDGPFVVRGERLDTPGVMDTGGGQEPIDAPLIVPPGPTDNTFAGYRTVPNGVWVTSPGCYAWQIDGLTFSEVIVVQLRSGVLAGTLEAIGPVAPRPLPGQITIRGDGLPAQTVEVGADGKFSVPVTAGTYTVTGRSPLYQGGNADCMSDGPISVDAGATQRLTVVCSEA